MSIHAKIPRHKTFTGIHMFFAMFAFFAVIIAVNITMATFAMGSWTGLVVKNSYVASQKFNRELEAARLQRESGFHSKLTYSSGKIEFVLLDRNSQRVKLDQAYVEIGRPAFEQSDMKLDLVQNHQNTFNLPINLAAGIWALKIHGIMDDLSYRRDLRLIVDENGSGKLL